MVVAVAVAVSWIWWRGRSSDAVPSSLAVQGTVTTLGMGSHAPPVPMDGIPTPQVVDALAAIVASATPAARHEALIDLNYLGWYVDAASAPTWAPTQPALRAQVGATRARLIELVPALARIVRDGSLRDRDEASWVLARLGPAAASASAALAAFAGDEAVPPTRRQHALVALGKVAGATAMPVLAKAMDPTEDVLVRYAATRTLSLAGPDAVKVLAPLLTDADPLIRATAARVLGDLGSPARASLAALLTAYREDRDASVRLASLQAWSRLSVGDANAREVLRDIVAAEPLSPICQAAVEALSRNAGDAVTPTVCYSRARWPSCYERSRPLAFTTVLRHTFPRVVFDPSSLEAAREPGRSPLRFWPKHFGAWPDGDRRACVPVPALLDIGIEEERISEGTVHLGPPTQGLPGLIGGLRIADDGRVLDAKIVRLSPEHWEVDIRTLGFARTDGVEEFGTRWPLIRLWVRQRRAPDAALMVESQLICDLEHDRCLSENPVSVMAYPSGLVVRSFDAASVAARLRTTRAPAYARIVGTMPLGEDVRGPMAIVPAAEVLGAWDWRIWLARVWPSRQGP